MQILGDGFVLKFTPQARGSTSSIMSFITPMSIYPACAGINLATDASRAAISDLPRMRGDQPVNIINSNLIMQFTPHARGLTYHDSWSMSRKIIYPACAGITLCRSSAMVLFSNLPRRRGDQPNSICLRLAEHRFTPQARGSTRIWDRSC